MFSGPCSGVFCDHIKQAKAQSLCGASGIDIKHEIFTLEHLYMAISKVAYPLKIYLFIKGNEDQITNVV